MIDVQEKTLQSFLYNAKQVANTKKSDQLIAWTEALAPVKLINIFNEAKNKGKNRTFWQNSAADFSIVGIGTAYTIVAEEDRFINLEKEWTSLKESALVHDPFQQVGTGLMAVGGMDFDPLQKKTALWEKYPTSELIIPEMVVVRHHDNYYVTYQWNVTADTNVADIVRGQKSLQAFLQPKEMKPYAGQKILAQEEIAPEAWKQSVQKAVDAIKNDEAKKIVLAREMRLKLNQHANIAWMIQQLIDTQPNSYVFAFEQGDNCFIGATPERLVQVEKEALLSTCLAGTSPRGRTEAEDKQLANDLWNDPKNREEHDYVVQMIRGSIEDDCTDITIPNEPSVMTLRNLQHLYTPVTATLKGNGSVLPIVEKLHPTPALGGLPNEAALKFIREEEVMDRGWYGAPVGWMDSNENSEFAVAIRSGLVQGDEISLFAGCGVMRDSDPQMEYEETAVKFLPMYNILEDKDESY